MPKIVYAELKVPDYTSNSFRKKIENSFVNDLMPILIDNENRVHPIDDQIPQDRMDEMSQLTAKFWRHEIYGELAIFTSEYGADQHPMKRWTINKDVIMSEYLGNDDFWYTRYTNKMSEMLPIVAWKCPGCGHPEPPHIQEVRTPAVKETVFNKQGHLAEGKEDVDHNKIRERYLYCPHCAFSVKLVLAEKNIDNEYDIADGIIRRRSKDRKE